MYRKINSQTTEADSVILHYVRKRIWQKAEIGKYLPTYFVYIYLFIKADFSLKFIQFKDNYSVVFFRYFFLYINF